jgi:hypothetical protein
VDVDGGVWTHEDDERVFWFYMTFLLADEFGGRCALCEEKCQRGSQLVAIQ